MSRRKKLMPVGKEIDAVPVQNGSMLALFFNKAKAVDGRKKKPDHAMALILVMMLTGYLVGEMTYRGVCRLFRPDYTATLLKSQSEKQRDLLSDDAGLYSEEALEKWRTDYEDNEKERKERAEHILNIMEQYFGELPYGLPDYTVISRAMKEADSVELTLLLYDFFLQLIPDTGERHLAIDGKAIRAVVLEELAGKPFYIVNTYDTAARLVLYSFKVGSKTNEMKSLEAEIRNIIFAQPSVTTTDAMGTAKKLLELITKGGSNYVNPVKSNNRNLEDGAREFMIDILEGIAKEKLPEGFASKADLDQLRENETPSEVIENVIAVTKEEDNDKYSAEGENPELPIDSFPFFDSLYGYQDYSEYQANPAGLVLDPLNPDLVYVKIGGRLIPMQRIHGRLERREFELMPVDSFREKYPAFCVGFESIAMIGMATRYRGTLERDRKTKEKYWKVTITRTPYIISDSEMTIDRFMSITKQHWSVEMMHNDLDNYYGEDRCTTKSGDAPLGLSCLRKAARNMQCFIAGMHQISMKGQSFEYYFQKVRSSFENGGISYAMKYLAKNLSNGLFARV